MIPHSWGGGSASSHRGSSSQSSSHRGGFSQPNSYRGGEKQRVIAQHGKKKLIASNLSQSSEKSHFSDRDDPFLKEYLEFRKNREESLQNSKNQGGEGSSASYSKVVSNADNEEDSLTTYEHKPRETMLFLN